MVKYQGPSRRKLSGGLRKKSMDKKLRHLAKPPTQTQIGETKRKKATTLGGNWKIKLLTHNKVNVLDTESGLVKNVTITGMDANPASRDYSRRKVITKGAVLETELGLAKVTNRPGSDSVINAILVKN